MSASMKVLIGYDGSPQSEIALQDLQRAGLPADIDAVVLTVADARILTKDHEQAVLGWPKKQLCAKDASASATLLIDEASVIAHAGCSRLQTIFPNWAVRAEVTVGLPGWEIVRKSKELHSDLVVVGANGRSPLDHSLLGRVSHTVLTQAICSVRVARTPVADPQQPLRLLIGIDGSRGAEETVKAVAQRIWPTDTELRLVVGLEPVQFADFASSLVLHRAVIADQYKTNQVHAEQVAQATAEMLTPHNTGLKVSTLVKPGKPQAVLLEEAEQWGATCIFLGACGQNWSVRQTLGRVSSAGAMHAKCSVEVVRSRC